MPFSRRGLHLDFRIQAMPMPGLLSLADDLASLGYNFLLVEWEATFPFERHATISNHLAYSPRDVRRFIGHCSRLGLEVVPLQQTFGHLEYILRHDRYAALREDRRDLCQLCPSKQEESVAVFSEVLGEIAAMHPAPYLHIGGDETYLLGRCPTCAARAARDGLSTVYVDYVARIAREVLRLGKRPLIWADMLLKHPEAAAQLPKECILVDWNYGWAVDRFGDPTPLSRLGFEFWAAPALRSDPDNHSLIMWEKHFNNLRDYLPYAAASRFTAAVLTSWSTSGLYGYEWESSGDPLDILPVRRVYPLSACRILYAAFAQACGQDHPLDVAAFVVDYACSRFGFSSREAKQFCRALSLDVPKLDATTPLANALRKSLRIQRVLQTLSPHRHRAEFAHFQLLADLRVHEVRVRLLERKFQSPNFRHSRASLLARSLPALTKENRALARRYASLQRGFLHATEIQRDIEFRSKRLRELRARLLRLSGASA